MSVTTELHRLLGPLVNGGCYPDELPDVPTYPAIVYQGAGGITRDYLERRLPNCEHYRVQVNCWAKARDTADALAMQIRVAIIEDGLVFVSAKTLGQAITLYEKPLKLYGTRQDYGIWFKVR